MSSPIIVALDFETQGEAMALVDALGVHAAAPYPQLKVLALTVITSLPAEPHAAFAEALSQFKAGSGNG